MTCLVVGCVKGVKARGLCAAHYYHWQEGHDLPPTSGPVPNQPPRVWSPPWYHEPIVCECGQPLPTDMLGGCDRCGRLIVAFAHPSVAHLYEQRWPILWDRSKHLPTLVKSRMTAVRSAS